MFSKIGGTELLIILAVALLIFGPSLLPKMGRSIGKTLAGFKKGLQEEGDDGASASVKKEKASQNSES